MTSIPGLSFCPPDESGEGVVIPSFQGKVVVPDSHWLGHCRTVNDFERVKYIAEGSFGEIYKCKRKGTDEYYALKTPNMPSNGGFPSSFLREITLLSTLRHENIISYFGTVAGKLESNYLILEYCPVSLNDLILKHVNAIYGYDVVKCIMKQLFEGLAYIHDAAVIHRDISDENIVFTERGVLKITGFSSSRYYTKENMTPGLCDLMCRAPELLFQTKKYNSAVDMWSAGCIFAKLLLKKPLFHGSSELEVLRSIFTCLGIPSKDIWPGFDELLIEMAEASKLLKKGNQYNDLKKVFADQPLSCYDLIKNILIYYPEARYSAKACLKSTYITELPDSCSLEKFSSILKAGMPSEDPEIEDKIDTNFIII